VQAQNSTAVREDGLSRLCRAVAPLQVRVRFAPEAMCFELSWDGPAGPESALGESLEAATEAAAARLLPDHGARAPVTEPSGDTHFAEAMRELIEHTSATRRRPRLRLVR